MNAKLAKRLRRKAHELSEGSEVASYAGIRRKMVTQQAVLADCERATYKSLKKLASPA